MTSTSASALAGTAAVSRGCFFFFSSRRRHTRLQGDWSSDVCSSDLLVAAGMLPASLASQLDSAATIRGTASSTFNGHPLTGVMVSVPAVHRFAVSDSDGRFELAGLPSGRQRVRVSYEGRNTEEYDFDLRRGKVKKPGPF